MTKRLSVCFLFVFLLGLVTFQAESATDKSYVLLAKAKWGASHTAAVVAAGGNVTYSHKKAGIGIATSSETGFDRKVLKSGLFQSAGEDVMVDWQPKTKNFDVEENVVTPGDETFFNLQWNNVSIDAQGAWDEGFTGAGVRVAILDGGIHSTHVDLDANIDVAASTSFVPGFAFNQDTGTFWHGTHVAGIVAAEDNGIGTVGVAPSATIIGVKVLHSGSGTFGAVIQGILYAGTSEADGGGGADIINMSLGATFAKGGGNTGAGALVSALNKAVNYASQNALVVVSAGNSGIDFDHSGPITVVPGQSGHGLTVSATGPLGFAVGWPNGATNFRRQASYTNFGNSLVNLAGPGGDFVLPGSAICTVPPVTHFCWVFDMVISTSRGSGASTTSYSFAAGTSMAAPAVAGVAALVKERFPFWGPSDIKGHLQATADDEGKGGNDPVYGKGFVNAARACTE